MIMGIDEKLYDFLYNFLKESRMMEQANKRKVSMEKVDDLTLQVLKHIIKIVCFEDNQNRNHWKGEVSGWLGDMYLYAKTKNGRLKQKDLMNIMWYQLLESQSEFDDMLSIVDDEYMYDLVDTPQNLYEKMYDVIENVCLILSGSDSSAVKSFIRSL